MELNRILEEKEIYTGDKYFKMSSTALTIRKIKITATLRFYIISVRRAIIKRKKWQQVLICLERGKHLSIAGRGKNGAVTTEVRIKVLKKLETDLPYDPSIPTEHTPK